MLTVETVALLSVLACVFALYATAASYHTSKKLTDQEYTTRRIKRELEYIEAASKIHSIVGSAIMEFLKNAPDNQQTLVFKAGLPTEYVRFAMGFTNKLPKLLIAALDPTERNELELALSPVIEELPNTSRYCTLDTDIQLQAIRTFHGQLMGLRSQSD